jgi:DNA replication and repair protein RecF
MLNTLTLLDFRNHGKRKDVFSPGVTVIAGENAVGKTNILEAIWLLATGESFRARRIEEMVSWGKEVGHIIGEVGSPSASSGLHQKKEDGIEEAHELQVTVTRGMVQGKRVQKRLFKLNGLGKRRADFIGALPAVLFRPEDMELLSGSPDQRRAFLDEVLIQLDREYTRSLVSYQKGLKQRNRLLDQIREGRAPRTTLTFWDQLLVREGAEIVRKRELLVENMNTHSLGNHGLMVTYQPSLISLAKLIEHAEAEVAMGYTLVGPHKDDFGVMAQERDLAIYGSRGEQRMAILWLKEAQLTVLAEGAGDRPLLLLDDIFSELDEKHVALVVQLAASQQTVITTTDAAIIDHFTDEARLVHLNRDRVG